MTYLTPPNSQGFAPHYDDIEAFILQIEGEKHWKLHPPRNDNEILARESSGNFTDKDLSPPFLEVRLEQGDLLYFPRGFIHQAGTVPGTHSLHITLSTYQKNSWGDFLLELLPKAVQNAIENDVEFRKGVPHQHLNYLGQHQLPQTEEEKIQRKEFMNTTVKLLGNLTKYLDINHSADKRCVAFIHESLPPALTNAESEQSAVSLTRWKVSSPHPHLSIDSTSQVRLLRPDSIRLVCEKGQTILYNTAENSRVYREKPPQSIELEDEFVSAIKSLMEAYPTYISVQDIPNLTDSSKIDIVEVLFSQNLLELISDELEDSLTSLL